MFKLFLFIALVVFVAWMLIFQLLIPWLQGTPFFPIFRAKQIRELEAEMAAVRQEIAADEMKTVLATMKPQANNEIRSTN